MTLVGFATVIGCTVAANPILKLGAGVSDAERVLLVSAGSRAEARSVRVWRYRLCLPAAPGAAQYCSGVRGSAVCRSRSAASMVRGELISPARWLGIARIVFGILLVGLTAHA